MGNRINVQNAKVALVMTNTKTDYALDTAMDLPGLMSIDLALTLATGTLYGDGVKKSDQSKVTGATLKVGLNKIPIQVRAKMTGAKITNGILDVTTDDQAPKIAFYAETEADDGTKEQLWLLCGEAQPIGLAGKQTENNINFSTDELTINFTQREKDKKVLRLADTANEDFTKSEEFANDPDELGA